MGKKVEVKQKIRVMMVGIRFDVMWILLNDKVNLSAKFYCFIARTIFFLFYFRLTATLGL